MTKTQLFSKKQTQRVIRDLKHEGYTVKKDSGGLYNVYVSNLPGDKRVLVAMPGTRGYLVRYDEELLTPAN
jgi:hypothetical protein